MNPYDAACINIWYDGTTLHATFLPRAHADLGAIPLISDKGVLGAAAAVMGVEGYHAASIRTLLHPYASEALFPYGAPVNAVINAISALRDAAAGTTMPRLEAGIIDVNGNDTLVPTNSASLLNARSVAQVLSIVYLGGSGKGGFYPMGMNGLFK
ncbi:MAG: hypothetical protein WDW38_009460 [Sanguina aurantia]